MNIENYVEQVAQALKELGYRIPMGEVEADATSGSIRLDQTDDPAEDYPADLIEWNCMSGWTWILGLDIEIDSGSFAGPVEPPVEEVVPRIATFLARV